MLQRIELLVHAGAPSSRKDDDNYKAQAEAYFAFQGRRVSVSELESQGQPEHAEEELGGDGSGSNGQREETTVVESPIFLDGTQLAITGLESQLLTSSLPIGPTWRTERQYASQDSPEDLTSSPPEERPVDADMHVSREDLLAQIRSSGKRKRDDDLGDVGGPSQGDDDHQKTGDELEKQSREQDATSSTNPSLSSYLKTPIFTRSAKKARSDKDGEEARLRAPLPSVHAAVNGRQDRLADSDRVASTGHEQQPPAATAPAAVVRYQESLVPSEPTSELPTSYSLSDITSESSRARAGISQRSASDPGAGGNAALTSSGKADSSTVTDISGNGSAGQQAIATTTPRIGQEVKPALEIIVIADDTPTEGAITKSATNGPKAATACPYPDTTQQKGVPTSAADPIIAPPAEDLQALQALSTCIYPSEPQVSIKRFTTHVTPALANLASNADMAGRYNPVFTSRELRPLERGHWLFDTCLLSVDQQLKLWQFMEQAIANGRPGWGVWCERNGGSNGLGTMRVWCWGEVVKHVYLLLYVGSSSQIRKLGARWVDAEGIEIVRMKGPVTGA